MNSKFIVFSFNIVKKYMHDQIILIKIISKDKFHI